jgi:hypothetical protein
MNKKLVILIAIALLALGTFFFLGSVLGTAVTSAVNSIAPQVTGTKVTLGSALISPFNGSGSLHELYVGNPEGFSDGKAFSCGKVHVQAKILSVFSDTIVIDEIAIEAPEFIYETKLTSSNIGKILDNVNKFAGSPAPDEKAGPQKKIIYIWSSSPSRWLRRSRATNAGLPISAVGSQNKRSTHSKKSRT